MRKEGVWKPGCRVQTLALKFRVLIRWAAVGWGRFLREPQQQPSKLD